MPAPAELVGRASGVCAESRLDYPQIPNLRLGTSSWSSQDWVGGFYPAGTAAADFISEYATHYAGFAPGSIKLFYEVWERMGAGDE